MVPAVSSPWVTKPDLVGDVDVLVVDDDEALRSSVADILRGEGMNVLEAVDGLDALDLLTSSRVGVMVLDVNMPRLTGPELLACLADPPLVVLLTASPYDDEVLAQGPKITWFLKKPVLPRELITIVARCLDAISWRSPPDLKLLHPVTLPTGIRSGMSLSYPVRARNHPVLWCRPNMC